MGYSPPNTVDAHVLDSNDARRLWNWQLGRQGLAAGSRLGSVQEIAHASFGLHAARLPSPFATVLARGATSSVATSLFSSETRASVVTVRCMRKTLHALPLPLAAAAHAATLHFRERDALRTITNSALSARLMTRVTAAIVELLSQTGPLFHRDIETLLVGPRVTVQAVRLALKLAWERGILTYLNETRAWNREHRKFGITTMVYPGLDMAMERREATSELVREYFDRYGPASIVDVMWWSGLSRGAVTEAMNESLRQWSVVRTPWTDSPMYMYSDRMDEYAATTIDERQTGLNLLAHEDVALKAYFETRKRYLGDLPAERAFNQIGEVLPTLAHNGQIVGTWAWDIRSRQVVCTVASGYGSAELRRSLKRQAPVTTEALRAGWTTGAVAREDKDQLTLTS
ncbi:MAG TPA: crosslink repair DNA glycosylase YcaQ family protein [Pseudonocardiaceae bacterium]|nr:crosslink repair DNA glycosylase YcaQ family protein [Pseudonocardiaceae bacterium]